MFQVDKRVLFIFLIIVALTFSSYALLYKYTEKNEFDQHLSSIKSQKEVFVHLHEAKSYIDFFTQGIDPPAGSREAIPIARLHFELGEALLSLNEPEYLKKALSQYKATVQWFPKYNHGWPFHQMGKIYEKLNQPKSAIKNYRSVSQYDFGNLSIFTGYRIALLQSREGQNTFEIHPIYNYLRFSSREVFQDVFPFTNSLIKENDYTPYVQSLLHYSQGKKNLAAQAMKTYLDWNPEDYSAFYYLDLFNENFTKDMYPQSGNLLKSCYAPLGKQYNHLVLGHAMSLLSDIYIPEYKKNSIQITVHFTNSSRTAFNCLIKMNGHTQDFKLPLKEKVEISASFPITQTKNIMDLHMTVNKPPDLVDRDFPVFIHVNELRVSLIPVESTL